RMALIDHHRDPDDPDVHGAPRSARPLQLRGLFDDLVGLDDVVLLELVPASDHHAALVALLDLADVVLEPAQAADLAFVDLDGVANDPQVGFARDPTLGDHAAGDRAHPGDRERLADLQLAHRDLALDRREQAGHRGAHVVERVVDDVVEPDLDALLLGEL